MDVKRFLALKEKIARLQKEKNRAEGALARTMEEIRSKFGAKDLGEAKVLLRRLERSAREIEAECEEKLTEFEEKWGERLG